MRSSVRVPDHALASIEGQLPATLEISFPRPTAIDTNLIVWYATDIRGVNYKLEGLTTDGKWLELYNVAANRHRDVVHRFPSRTVTKVRLTLLSTAGQNRVVMREFLLYQGLTAAEEKILMANAARCLGPNEESRQVELGVAVKAVVFGNSQRPLMGARCSCRLPRAILVERAITEEPDAVTW